MIAKILSAIVIVICSQLYAGELGPRQREAIATLLTQLELDDVRKDNTGNITWLRLRREYANDASLATVGFISSIQELVLQGGSGKRAVTATGIAYLGELTNLTALQFGCDGLLNPGVLEQICNLGNLRILKLDLACPPKRELLCLTNLQNLAELRITYCPNFGDAELSALTNLPRLKSLALYSDGFSKEGTNVLRRMTGLTNVVVRVKDDR